MKKKKDYAKRHNYLTPRNYEKKRNKGARKRSAFI